MDKGCSREDMVRATSGAVDVVCWALEAEGAKAARVESVKQTLQTSLELAYTMGARYGVSLGLGTLPNL